MTQKQLVRWCIYLQMHAESSKFKPPSPIFQIYQIQFLSGVIIVNRRPLSASGSGSTSSSVSNSVCGTCGQQLSCAGALKRHVKLVHLKQKDYSCKYCSRAFSTASNLKKHVHTMHIAYRPFKCFFCDMTFKKLALLNSHLFSEHGGKRVPPDQWDDFRRIEAQLSRLRSLKSKEETQ